MQQERRADVGGAKRLAIASAVFVLAMASGLNLSTAQTKPAPSPAGQTRYVIGKPYQFDGVWYRPAADDGYDQTGVASIYPARPAGLATTSGEVYDQNAITAAHKTLPLPSMARVTNLANGKSIALRINDRGPFVDNEIIELSPAAAVLLGISNQATARVRVQIMAAESAALATSLGGDAVAHSGGAVTPAPAPVVKVTSLPLLTGPAVQPLKPVAAPTPPTPTPSAAPTPPLLAPAPAKPVAVLTPTQAPVIPAALKSAPATAVSVKNVNTVASAASTPPPVSPPPKPSTSGSAVAASTGAAPLPPVPAAQKPLPVDLPAQFFIQTGAFNAPTEAEQLRIKLADMGKTKIVPTRLGTSQFNAVLLGPISSMAEAHRLLRQIAAMGYPDAVLIIE
jgi:rare lipoprotein A